MSFSSIPAALLQLTSDRAERKCEYCLIHQDFSIYRQEVDPIIAVKHGGQTSAENLALSCLPSISENLALFGLPCIRYKGFNLSNNLGDS